MNTKSIYYITNRSNYFSPYEFAEQQTWVNQVDLSEEEKKLKNKRIIIFMLSDNGSDIMVERRFKFASIIKSKNCYDTFFHYLWPSNLKNPKLLEARIVQLLNFFNQSDSTCVLDLIIEGQLFERLKEALKNNNKKIFSNIYLVYTRMKNIEFQFSGDNGRTESMRPLQSLYENNFSNAAIRKACHKIFSFEVLLQSRTQKSVLEVRNSKEPGKVVKVGLNSINDLKTMLEILANTVYEELKNKAKTLLQNVFYINDCKNLIRNDELSYAQDWKKEMKVEECFPLLEGKKIAILVHGMANTMQDAFQSYNMISSKLNENYDVFVYYLWPGAGFWPFSSYDNSGDEKGTKPFHYLLKSLSKIKSKIDVIAHSMGNRLTLESLKLLEKEGQTDGMLINNFFMIAPAVPEYSLSSKENIYFSAIKKIRRIIVLWTKHDEAMPFYKYLVASFGKNIKFGSQGLGDGVTDIDNLASNAMIINVSQMVDQHGLAKFEKAFPLISRLIDFIETKNDPSLLDIKIVVDKFFKENGYKLYSLQRDKTLYYEYPVCQFNGSPDRKKYFPINNLTLTF